MRRETRGARSDRGGACGSCYRVLLAALAGAGPAARVLLRVGGALLLAGLALRRYARAPALLRRAAARAAAPVVVVLRSAVAGGLRERLLLVARRVGALLLLPPLLLELLLLLPALLVLLDPGLDDRLVPRVELKHPLPHLRRQVIVLPVHVDHDR